MAPLAPTMGTRESGLNIVCVNRGGDPAQQVKNQVFAVAQDVFDIVPEDPQKPHVAQHVHPTAVEEHGRQHVDEVKAVGSQAVRGNECVLLVRAQREFEQKHQNIDYDQKDRYDGLGIARLCIAYWKHLVVEEHYAGARGKIGMDAPLSPRD